jgi:hypothetical protein
MCSSGCPDVRTTGSSGHRTFTSYARSIPFMMPRSRMSAKITPVSRPLRCRGLCYSISGHDQSGRRSII